MLTTKAEMFIYFDPFLGKLYYVPIYPLRAWYKSVGLAKKHLSVNNKTYSSEGIVLSIAELERIIPTMEIEDIEPLNQNEIKILQEIAELKRQNNSEWGM